MDSSEGTDDEPVTPTPTPSEGGGESPAEGGDGTDPTPPVSNGVDDDL